MRASTKAVNGWQAPSEEIAGRTADKRMEGRSKDGCGIALVGVQLGAVHEATEPGKW